jgi:hypothetical protein
VAGRVVSWQGQLGRATDNAGEERLGWRGTGVEQGLGESRTTAQLMRDLRRQYAEDTGIANRHYKNDNGEQRMCGVAG